MNVVADEAMVEAMQWDAGVVGDEDADVPIVVGGVVGIAVHITMFPVFKHRRPNMKPQLLDVDDDRLLVRLPLRPLPGRVLVLAAHLHLVLTSMGTANMDTVDTVDTVKRVTDTANMVTVSTVTVMVTVVVRIVVKRVVTDAVRDTANVDEGTVEVTVVAVVRIVVKEVVMDDAVEKEDVKNIAMYRVDEETNTYVL